MDTTPASGRTIVILEDNIRRMEEMRRVLPNGYQIFIERTQVAAIERIERCHSDISAISLDHDLEKYDPGEPDPGDGRDVARWLAESGHPIPVLIHTSNATMGDSMFFTLVDAGFRVDRIDPYDDLAWIGRSWLPKLLRLASPTA